MRPSIVTGPHGLDEMLFAICSNVDIHDLTEYCSRRIHESRTYIDGYMFPGERC